VVLTRSESIEELSLAKLIDKSHDALLDSIVLQEFIRYNDFSIDQCRTDAIDLVFFHLF
jgi:hypothetical protein